MDRTVGREQGLCHDIRTASRSPVGGPAGGRVPPPPGLPVRPPLRRSRSDKVIGGVAGGLADYSGIDALLWRVGLVALALAGPGVPVYLLLWLLMPAGPPGDPPPSPGPARRRVRASPVPGLTLAGLLIVVGSLVLLSRLTDWDVGPPDRARHRAAVVGARPGRRRLLRRAARPGAGCSPRRAAVARAGGLRGGAVARRRGRHGRPHVPPRPTRTPSNRSTTRGVGNATLDLSRIDLSGLDGPIVTRVDGGIGNVEVLVPRSADVRIEWTAASATPTSSASDPTAALPGTGSASWTGDGDPEIELTIDAGVGDVEVRRA
jgi:phage shock protein PspC (stress-responsive transcriptional regulator)